MRPTRTPTPDTNREAYILRAHRLRIRDFARWVSSAAR
jgi:hypothetical protein